MLHEYVLSLKYASPPRPKLHVYQSDQFLKPVDNSMKSGIQKEEEEEGDEEWRYLESIDLLRHKIEWFFSRQIYQIIRFCCTYDTIYTIHYTINIIYHVIDFHGNSSHATYNN